MFQMVRLFARAASIAAREEVGIAPEGRAATVVSSNPEFLKILGLDSLGDTAAGETVTVDRALGVPAVWSAVNFIAGTIAALPVRVHRHEGGAWKDQPRVPVRRLLGTAANDALTAYDWKKRAFVNVLTGGRSLTYIERDDRGQPRNLFPLDPSRTTVRATGMRKAYHYRQPGDRETVYAEDEIIDLAFMLKDDGVAHYSPLITNREVIALAIAATKYGARFLMSGGLPPFAVVGNFESASSIARAAQDLEAAVQKAHETNKQALVMPRGLDVKPLGADPDKAQLVELQRFLIEQVARIYSIPPAFVQDLTHGTFSNTEQQDLQFVKHTLTRWIVQFEQELTLKLFGRDATRRVKCNVDGLLRGDFKTRMEGHARAVQAGVSTPNEARALEDRPEMEGGGQLYVQGATVPLVQAGQTTGSATDTGDDT